MPIWVCCFRATVTESADIGIAETPFNLNKDYGKDVSDLIKDADYTEGPSEWLKESVLSLKPDGELFVFNLPRWLIITGASGGSQGMFFVTGLPVVCRKTFRGR